MLILRQATPTDRPEVEAAYARSHDLHQPWTFPPQDYDQWLNDEHRYLLCLEASGAVVGQFHLSGLVRGAFLSAYLGYEVFSPYQNRGYMSRGLAIMLERIFGPLGLHRVEANIQPGNHASRCLVYRHGFVLEGYSQGYLNIGGQGWKDHERWALTFEEWTSLRDGTAWVEICQPHISNYPQPVTFQPGDRLSLGIMDHEYPGWIRVTDASSTGEGTSKGADKDTAKGADKVQEGWAPVQYLDFISATEARALRSYSACELSVQPGQRVRVLQRLNGWAEVISVQDQQGWIPLQCLPPLQASTD